MNKNTPIQEVTNAVIYMRKVTLIFTLTEFKSVMEGMHPPPALPIRTDSLYSLMGKAIQVI